MKPQARRLFEFGSWYLDATDRMLVCNTTGKPVPLAPKAVETLLVLVEKRGRLVTKDELMRAVWPDTFVEEAGLARNISVLRKALGETGEASRYIETIPRRGYRFVASVRERQVDQEAGTEALPLPRFGPEPRSLMEMTSPRMTVWRRLQAQPAWLVAGIVLVATGYFAWQHHRARPPRSADRILLAVLPFENLGGDPGQEYFTDGLTEEMITQLGGLHPARLGVIARQSVMRYKHRDRPVDQIGRELGVQFLLEGSVRRAGQRVRITAQLIQVSDQSHLWAKAFERDLADMLSLQSDIARAIADSIQVELTPGRAAYLAGARPMKPEAYEAYLKGQYRFNKRTTEGIETAIESFRQALEKDPNYAPAYAGLATSYAVVASGEDSTPQDTFEKARLAAKKALDLDGSLAEPHAVLALIAQNYDWNFQESEREFKRAIALNPSHAIARLWLSLGLAATGRFEEADVQMKEARELDPLSLFIRAGSGVVLYLERQPERAVEEMDKALEVEPNYGPALMNRGMVYAQLGKLKETIADFEAAKRWGDNDPRTVALFANALAGLGQKEMARRLLAELNDRARHEYVSPWCQAIVYTGLGQKDLAFQWLSKAFQERATDLVALKTGPVYDPLRSDPRFHDLLHRMNFPP